MSKISFVIPCYASELTIKKVVDEINNTMNTNNKYTHDIILVNDFSPDNTFDVIKQLCNECENIIGLNLSCNFGQHAALMAGFHYATGDIIICLDDDGQTPAKEVFKLIEKIEEGNDVVFASFGNKKQSFLKNFGSKINRIMTEILLDKPKEISLSSYVAVRRFVIDQVIEYRNPYPYVTGLILKSSKRIVNVEVKHKKREVGESGYTIKKLIGLWVNGFTAFSVKPLRIATFTGIIFALIGFLFTIYILINKILNPSVLLGWSSLISVLLIIGGIIMCMLGLIGEYIGRIYISLNNSPQYIIRETTLSSIDNKE